jgi:hypothetical protein
LAATPPHTTSAESPSRASARRDLRTSTSTTAACCGLAEALGRKAIGFPVVLGGDSLAGASPF